jgi:hypothetical protein
MVEVVDVGHRQLLQPVKGLASLATGGRVFQAPALVYFVWTITIKIY